MSYERGLFGHFTLENTVERGQYVNVFLDGKFMKGCTEAHTEEGWLRCLVYSLDGKLVINGDEIACQTLRGKVTVTTVTFGDKDVPSDQPQ